MLSAAAVNKTFISPNVIKWSGFQVIGESLLSVLQCQHHPYNFDTRDETLERAILETPDISEQVINLIIFALTSRNSMRNRMNSNRQNGHTRNPILQDLSGFQRRSQGDKS